MSPTVRLALTGAAALVGAALLSPTGAAADFAPQPSPPPAVTGTLEVTCTQEIPVPTVIATAANTTAWPQPVSLVRNGTLHTGFAVDAGGDEQEVIAETAWEDEDNHFQLVSNGAVLAELHHHFDCLHPIISVAIANPCADVPVPVVVTNSGHEGTHVTVTVDGAVVAEPSVAPGHSTQVDVTGAVGTMVAVHHQGALEADVELVACATGLTTDQSDPGNDHPDTGPIAHQPETANDRPDDGSEPHDPEPERPTGRPRTKVSATGVAGPADVLAGPASPSLLPHPLDNPTELDVVPTAPPTTAPADASTSESPGAPDPVGAAALFGSVASLAAAGVRKVMS